MFSDTPIYAGVTRDLKIAASPHKPAKTWAVYAVSWQVMPNQPELIPCDGLSACKVEIHKFTMVPNY